MAKIALVGDLHFREKGLSDIAAAWGRTLDICDERAVEVLLQAGDVFDYFNIAGRGASFGTVFDAFALPLRKWIAKPLPDPQKKRRALIVRGNHDTAGAGQKDALVPLDGTPGVIVAHGPSAWKNVGEFTVACLPWLTKAHLAAKEEWADLSGPALDEVYGRKVSDVLSYLKHEISGENAGYRILLAHCQLNGVRVNPDTILVGESFTLDRALLERVGADRIVLGHIHLRQEYYLGGLTQLSFTDQDNPTGFEILDTETRESEWVEVTSPRYFTLAPEEYAPGKYLPTDHVKLKGTELPAGSGLFPTDLPPGVIFEKIISPAVMTRRFSEGLDPGSPVELLKVWCRETACNIDPETLIAGLTPLLAGQQAAPPAIGSFQGISRLKLHNVASHKDTDIAFPTGLVALTGHNGAGKTFMLEAAPAIFYGEFPSRPGPIFDYLPPGDSLLELEFQSGGETYRARRDIHITGTGRGRSQDGYLFKGEATIAGGPARMADFENACRNLIGDRGLVLASIFSSQNGAGDLCDAKPTERRVLFHQLLGLEGLTAIAEGARDASRLLWGRVQEKEDSIKRDGEEILKKAEFVSKIAEIDAELVKTGAALTELEAERAEIIKDKTLAADVEKGRREQVDKREQIKKDLTAAAGEIKSLEDERKETETLLKRGPEIEENIKLRANLQAKVDGSRAQELAKTKRLAHIKELETEINNQTRALETERKTLQDKLTRAEAQAAILKTGDFSFEPCKKCILLGGAHESAKEIEALEDALGDLEIRVLEKKFAEPERRDLAMLIKAEDEMAGLDVPGGKKRLSSYRLTNNFGAA